MDAGLIGDIWEAKGFELQVLRSWLTLLGLLYSKDC